MTVNQLIKELKQYNKNRIVHIDKNKEGPMIINQVLTIKDNDERILIIR